MPHLTIRVCELRDVPALLQKLADHRASHLCIRVGHGDYIWDPEARRLAEALHAHPLVSVEVCGGYNYVNAAGASELAAAVRASGCLTHLDLGFFPPDNDALEGLAEALEANRTALCWRKGWPQALAPVEVSRTSGHANLECRAPVWFLYRMLRDGSDAWTAQRFRPSWPQFIRWTPATHSRCPAEVRRRVVLILLVVQRHHAPLPPEGTGFRAGHRGVPGCRVAQCFSRVAGRRAARLLGRIAGRRAAQCLDRKAFRAQDGNEASRLIAGLPRDALLEVLSFL